MPEGMVDIGVTQVESTVADRQRPKKPVVHVYGRNDDGDVEHVRVSDFEPYFYAPPEQLQDYSGQKIKRLGDTYTSVRGETVQRAYTDVPRTVGQVRDNFDHYEADVRFPNRFLIDMGIQSGIRVPEQRGPDGSITVSADQVEPIDKRPEFRLNIFDIEVDDRSGFPENGEEPIVCITSYDSGREEYVAWIQTDNAGSDDVPSELSEYEPHDDMDDVDIRHFDREQEMLEAFLEYIEETDPDVLSGWNFDEFDAPYLIDRLDVLDDESSKHLASDRLSRLGEVWVSGWGGATIKGRVVFDLLEAYKRTQFTEKESYRLDAIAEDELGIGKETYTGDIGDLWEEDPERLLEYNLRDVELCVVLNGKQNIMEFWTEVSSFVGCSLDDSPIPGDAVDMYVLQMLNGEYVLPSKSSHTGEDYEGGAVFDAINGVRENVTVLDLKSLYPMCMTTINASPETAVDPDEYDGDIFRAPNGQHFRKEPDGVIREMIDNMLEEREEKKALRDEHDPGTDEYENYDRQQASVKVIMNCFTPDHEVLTPNGIVGIRDLEVGDEVYSYDPDAEAVEVKPVVETHAYPDYDGDIVDIETSTIDFSVTPNHRMLVRQDDPYVTEDEWHFEEVQDLKRSVNYEMPNGWSFDHPESDGTIDILDLYDGDGEIEEEDGMVRIVTNGNANWIPRYYDEGDFVEFLGWYIADGHSRPSKWIDDESTQTSSKVTVTKYGGEDRDDLDDLIDNLGLSKFNGKTNVTVCSRLFYRVISDACGSIAGEKRIPDMAFSLNESVKRKLLQTLLRCDGDWETDQTFRYGTKSETLRDDFMALCVELGHTPTYNRDSGIWRVRVTTDGKNSFRMNRSSEARKSDTGVYCVTVDDNNSLMAGKNGRMQFVGQSTYGVLGWDRFRLYDKDMAAAVTSTARGVLKETEKAVENANYSVIYGDTDSVMISLGSDVTKEEAIGQSKGLEHHINQSYDEFAREELLAEEHRFQIEFEKLYRRFFQAGSKKRYGGRVIWKEGKHIDDLDITGFEYQRSDIAPITKRVQRKAIQMIVDGEDTDDVAAYVRGEIQDYRDGQVSVEDVGMPSGIGKRLDNYDTDTAQVRGAKYANLLLGTSYASGSKPKRVYLERVHSDFFDRTEEEMGFSPSSHPVYCQFREDLTTDDGVICFEHAEQVPDEFETNWEKMLDKTLRKPIGRVLDALDIDWDEMENGQTQTGLEAFSIPE